MSSLWDAAETLIVMAGDAEAAIAAARGMAEDCVHARRPREAAYWRQVAWAVTWLANPQPLIAPETPPAPGSVVRPLASGTGGRRARQPKERGAGAVVHRLDFAAKLPVRRASLRRLRKKLREAWERHHRAPKPTRPARKPEPNGKD